MTDLNEDMTETAAMASASCAAVIAMNAMLEVLDVLPAGGLASNMAKFAATFPDNSELAKACRVFDTKPPSTPGKPDWLQGVIDGGRED